MKNLLLIICLFILTTQAFGQATGNIRLWYETAEVDSAFLVDIDRTGAHDTIHSVTDTTRIDTTLACSDLSKGVHIFKWIGYYDMDTTQYSAFDVFNNIASGETVATGSLTVAYDVDLCDSIMMIHEFSGTVDTAILTDVYSIDTTIACADLGVGVHNFIVRFLYDGDTDWLTASMIFHNSSAAAPVATTSNTCAVTVLVMRSDGNPARGVLVTAYLGGSNLADSSGRAIDGWVQRQRTNASGAATFNCVWSSYIVPATDWWFYVHTGGISGKRKILTVPRQVSYTLEF